MGTAYTLVLLNVESQSFFEGLRRDCQIVRQAAAVCALNLSSPKGKDDLDSNLLLALQKGIETDGQVVVVVDAELVRHEDQLSRLINFDLGAAASTLPLLSSVGRTAASVSTWNHRHFMWNRDFSANYSPDEYPVMNPAAWSIRTEQLRGFLLGRGGESGSLHPQIMALEISLYLSRQRASTAVQPPLFVTKPLVLKPAASLPRYYTAMGLIAARYIPWRRWRYFWRNATAEAGTKFADTYRFIFGLLVGVGRRIRYGGWPALKSPGSSSRSAITDQEVSLENCLAAARVEGESVTCLVPRAEVASEEIAPVSDGKFEQLVKSEEADWLLEQRLWKEWRRQNPPPISVAWYLVNGGVGGAEWAARLLQEVAKPDELRPTLVVRQPDKRLVPWLQQHVLRVLELPYSLSKVEIRQEMAAFDVVHFLMADTLDGRVLPLCGPAVVANVVNARFRCLPSEAPEKIDALAFVSQRILDSFPDGLAPASPRFLVRTGVPAADSDLITRSELGIPADARVLLWVGRLGAWEKNVNLLKRAIQETASSEVWWLVIGYWGPEFAAEEDEWRKFIHHRPVVWLPKVANWEAPAYYRLADLIVGTSASEGVPIALIQGAVIGKPVVSTSVGGIDEVVINEQTGLLSTTQPGDFLKVLKRAVLSSEDQLKQWGTKGARLASCRFSQVRAYRRQLMVYGQALHQRDPARWPAVAVSNPPALSRPTETFKRKLRIVFIIDQPVIAGLHWRLGNLAAHLQRKGHEVAVLFERVQEDGRLLDFLAQNGVAHWIAGDQAEEREWRQWLLNYSPDIVHIGFLYNLPVTICRGPWRTLAWFAGPDSAGWVMRNRPFFYQVAAITCVAPELLSLVPGEFQSRAESIVSGVDTQRFSPRLEIKQRLRHSLGIDDDQKVIIWVGRHRGPGNKRFDLLVELAHLFPQLYFLAVVGDPKEAAEDKEAHLPANLHLVRGATPWQLSSFYRLADAGLQTSDAEGINQASLEMLASGLPLILTDVGGSRRLLANDNGWLVPAGELSSLVTAVAELADLPSAELTEYGARSRLLAERDFGMDRYVEELIGLYRRLL